jgi:predicted metal-binding membrane protein
MAVPDGMHLPDGTLATESMPVLEGLLQVAASPAGMPSYLLAWGIMMAAMMLPSALPMILLYRGAISARASGNRPALSTASFTLVYLLVWTAAGVPVYLASEGIEQLAMANSSIAELLPYGIASSLLVAGLYQLTPLKAVCLQACQGPMAFLLRYWRDGTVGSLSLGLRHGLYCMGCCWALMFVLVFVGAMALHWVVLVAAVVFAEKLLPRRVRAAQITGGALLLFAAAVFVDPRLAHVLGQGGM